MADGTSSVDGVLSTQPRPAQAKSAPVPHEKNVGVKKWKLVLMVAGASWYVAFVGWCFLLMSVLPSMEDMSFLVMMGIVTSAIAALAFIGIGVFTFIHIAKFKASVQARKFALAKLAAAILPGLILAILTPLAIIREPALAIDITSPTTAEELIAPLAMNFNVERAIGNLAQHGFKPVQFKWDIDGDRKVDQETFEPTITANYEVEGINTISVIMVASDGSTRTASRKFIIRRSVFSVSPNPPIVDKTVVFSMAHLFPEPDAVVNVAWDFDNDGKIDDETSSVESSFTYLSTGKFRVVAVVQLTNNTQAQYERVIEVQNPAPLPFPVTLKNLPQNLIGTPPFSALFEIESSEKINGVQWNFGDGQRGEGMRVSHTFTRKGTFSVVARVRSQSGTIAEVSTAVKVVDKLDLPDLKFEGTPKVEGNKISGEVPLALDLKPVTQTPFITFSWEAPEATEVGSTDERLQAIFRRAGTYTVTLVGQDLQNHVLRLPVTVTVLPPSSIVTMRMEPETGVAPLTVKFDASETNIPGEDITGFIWNFGDGSGQEFGGAITQHTYRSPGTYVVNLSVRTTSGKQQSTTRTIVVRAPTVQARIFPSRLSGSAPFSVAFDGRSSVGTIVSYLWKFGDGSENDGQEVQHTYVLPGSYTVQLTVTDDTGKTATSTVTITVN